MPKSSPRAYGRYSQQAVELLGQLIRRARIEARLTTQVLAERAGISRGLLHRIENRKNQKALSQNPSHLLVAPTGIFLQHFPTTLVLLLG